MDNNEESFFDAEIAPLLRQVMELVKARGLAFIGAIEFAPDQLCTYVAIPPDTETSQAILQMAMVLYPEKFAKVSPAIAKA